MTIETLTDAINTTNKLIIHQLSKNELTPELTNVFLAANEKLVLLRHECEKIIRSRVYVRR